MRSGKVLGTMSKLVTPMLMSMRLTSSPLAQSALIPPRLLQSCQMCQLRPLLRRDTFATLLLSRNPRLISSTELRPTQSSSHTL